MIENNYNNRGCNPLTSSEVADRLAESLGGGRQRWITWLANDRRRARVLQPLPSTGRPQYLHSAVVALVAAMRLRRLHDDSPAGRIAAASHALGVGKGGGSPTGRRLDCQVKPHIDVTTGERFVQLCVAVPLLVFRLPADQSRALGSTLIAAADTAGPASLVTERAAS